MSSLRPDHYLVAPSAQILGSKLPSNGQSLAYFLHLRGLKGPIRETALQAMKKIEELWIRAKIPTRELRKGAMKLEYLYLEWRKLKKNINRRSIAQKKKEDAFKAQLKDLFDIAHGNAMSMMHNPIDRAFLSTQREQGRQGSMINTYKKAHETEELRNEPEEQQQNVMLEDNFCMVSTSEASLVNTDGVSSSQEEEFSPSPEKRGRFMVVSKELSSVLDRYKISNRGAMMIVAETARSLGHGIEPLALNYSTIRRKRMAHRETISLAIRRDFNPEPPLIVHWDGKIIEQAKTKEKEDRLAVMVTYMGKSKLLGAPKMENGTGMAQAKSVVSLLQEWNLTKHVQGLCFDTTPSNTGKSKGACVLIEKLLGKDLLYFPCRHHMLELVLGGAYQALHGCSSGPDVQLFKRFKEEWRSLDHSKYEDGLSHGDTAPFLEEMGGVEDLVQFFKEHLKVAQPRDDYKELLDLCLLFLGAHPSASKFRAPGPVHHARWMSKAIYSLKIWMFRAQFNITINEEQALRHMSLFIVTVYAKSWFLAPNILSAPRMDLKLLRTLADYPQNAIRKEATKKLLNHAWYLSEHLVGLAIFDETLPLFEREQVQKSFLKKSQNPPKRPSIHFKDLNGKNLAHFASEQSLRSIITLGLHFNSIGENINMWSENTEYLSARKKASSLTCINDHAERAVALIKDFNGQLSDDEEQLQWAFQVVEENREKYPNSMKSSFLSPK